MMKCKDVAQRASALLDKELPLWEVIELRLHLAICKGCKAFVRQMQITRSLTALRPPENGAAEAAAIEAIFARLHGDQGKVR